MGCGALCNLLDNGGLEMPAHVDEVCVHAIFSACIRYPLPLRSHTYSPLFSACNRCLLPAQSHLPFCYLLPFSQSCWHSLGASHPSDRSRFSLKLPQARGSMDQQSAGAWTSSMERQAFAECGKTLRGSLGQLYAGAWDGCTLEHGSIKEHPCTQEPSTAAWTSQSLTVRRRRALGSRRGRASSSCSMHKRTSSVPTRPSAFSSE